jgi:hypothetical protein
LDSCTELTKIPIAQDVLSSYSRGRGTRDSIGVANELSSAQSIIDGAFPLNQFQYSSLSPNSRPKFVSFTFDEKALEHLVKAKIPTGKDDVPFVEILETLTARLTNLRSIIYSGKWVTGISNVVWSEMRLQALMELFLNDMFDVCGSALIATGANSEAIEFTVDNVSWRGFTDIKCCQMETSLNLEVAEATLEMKVAFSPHSSRLFHSEAVGPKQQLFGQAFGLLTNERTHVLSYLTDIIALSIMYYVEGVAYLSERVTDEKAFCLRLMLQCCDLSTKDWSALLPAEGTCSNVSLSDDEVVSQAGASSSGGGATRQSAMLQRQTRSMSSADGASGKENSAGTYHTLGCEAQDTSERRMADICSLQVWEAKCFSRGVPYLGIDALNAHASNHRKPLATIN